MSKAQVEACTQVQRPWGRNALGELEAQKEAGGPGAGRVLGEREGSMGEGEGTLEEWAGLLMQASGLGV